MGDVSQTLVPQSQPSNGGGEMSKDESSTSRSKHCLILVVLLFLVMVPLCLSIYSFTLTQLSVEEFCLPCELVNENAHATPGLEVRRKAEDGMLKCCIASDKDLITLVSQVKENERLREAMSSNETSAHVLLYAKDKKKPSKSYSYDQLQFNRTSSLAHCHKVILQDNKLIILQSGLYFVYSSIGYGASGQTNCSLQKYKTWLHHVVRKREVVAGHSRNQLLLRTEHTCCQKCPSSRNSHFTGGAFYMLQGDAVWVEVSAPSLLFNPKESSYLGLFLVDDKAMMP